MSNVLIQFLEQDNRLVDIVSATSTTASTDNVPKILSDIANLIVSYISHYQSLLTNPENPLFNMLAQAKLQEILSSLKKDTSNTHKIVAVCYLLRSLSSDVPVQALKVTIDNQSYIHPFSNADTPHVYMPTTLLS